MSICRIIPHRCLPRRCKIFFVAAVCFICIHWSTIHRHGQHAYRHHRQPRPTLDHEFLAGARPKRNAEAAKHTGDVKPSSSFSSTSKTTTTEKPKPIRATLNIVKKEFAKTTEKPTTRKKATSSTKSTTTESTTTTTTLGKCSPGRPVMFLKTHKTGSTTLANIFLRYAEKYKLLAGLPPTRKWELGGYPAPFKKALVDPVPKTRYDVLAHHSRYSEEIPEVMPDDTLFVTSLRDPVDNFESGFGFFRDFPYPQWLGDNPQIHKFLDDPRKYYDKTTPWHFRAKNYMAFDLGLEYESDDESYMNEAIKLTEHRFGLVMITDRFEESAILLKHELCMDVEDVAYLRLKVRKESDRKSMSPEYQDKIKNWNKLDTALYDHFNALLDEKIKAFGKEKMQAEIEELNEKVEQLNTKCIERYSQFDAKPWISRIVLKPKAGAICEKMSMGEVLFSDTLRTSQKKGVTTKKKIKVIQPMMEELLELLRKEQVKILGNDAVSFSSGNAGSRH